MTQERKAVLLNRIGAILRSDKRFCAAGTLFVCEVADMFISISLFWDRGNYIAYNSPVYDDFTDIMFELWELDEPYQRWREMEYLLRGTDFEANFLYDEDIDPEQFSTDRIWQTAIRYLGDKEVVYPKEMGEDTFEL